MTMTQLIGDLERSGWRFETRGDGVWARVPSPRPPGWEEAVAELSRRSAEAASFLRARADADRLRELFSLPEIPVFAGTPIPEARVLTFPVRLESPDAPAAARRRR